MNNSRTHIKLHQLVKCWRKESKDLKSFAKDTDVATGRLLSLGIKGMAKTLSRCADQIIDALKE